MKPLHSRLTFPASCACLGGAEWVSYTQQYAWVKLPGQDKPVRVPRSRVPANTGQWSAFKLADAATSYQAFVARKERMLAFSRA